MTNKCALECRYARKVGGGWLVSGWSVAGWLLVAATHGIRPLSAASGIEELSEGASGFGVKVLQAFAALTPSGGNKASSDAPRRPCICAANTARPGALVRREPISKVLRPSEP